MTNTKALIAGETFHLNIEQFDCSAYIQVWGGNIDCDAPVATSDALLAISNAADGAREYDDETVAVLLLAADVLAHVCAA